MPLGLSARRRPIGTALGLALMIGLTGCNAVPSLSRATPKAGEVRTRVGADRERGAMKVASDEPEPPVAKLAFDRLDEVSPLPPAIDRARNGIELPPDDSASKPAAVFVSKPDPTPILDEALARADARTEAIAEEVVKASEAKDVRKPPSVIQLPPPGESPAVASIPVIEPKTPDETWREGVQRLRALARDRLKDANKGAGPGLPNWVVRDRLLGWLAEPDIDPDPRTGDQVAQGRAVLKGLAAILDPTVAPASRGVEIREAVAALESEAPLDVAELKLCVKVHGFGNIEPLEPAVGKPGKPLIVYCEMVGLAYEPIGPAFRSRLATQVDLLPEGSATPTWSQSLGTAEDACRRRRRDYYINYRLNLPETLAPGPYRLRLTQRDLVTDRSATRETGLTIEK